MPRQTIRAAMWLGLAGGIVAAVVAITGTPPLTAAPTPPAPVSDTRLLPLDDFAPQFLGMYRKAMTIEDDIRTNAEKYDVDIDLARAMLIQESGGNPNLTSIAGAAGYFQVMPATFRGLRVDTNIEAGIKYLSQMVRQFRREDYAVAAYNGGPGRARRGRPPLETLQYVLSVGAYRTALKLHEPSIRHHAETIRLEAIRAGDDWWAISQRHRRVHPAAPCAQPVSRDPGAPSRAIRGLPSGAAPWAVRVRPVTRTSNTGRGSETTTSTWRSCSTSAATTFASRTTSGTCRRFRPANSSACPSSGRASTRCIRSRRATTFAPWPSV